MATAWFSKAMIEIWGARDVQGQLYGVSRNKSVYLKIEAARTDLG